MLHVQRATGLSGSERHIATLVPELANAGITARVCVLQAEGAERFTNELRRRRIDVEVIPSRLKVDPVTVPRLVHVVRRFEPDIVHTHLVHADLYGQLAARLCRVPGVVSLHSTSPLFRRPPVMWAERRAARSAAGVIAISRHVQGFATSLKLADPTRISVIHYGIDPSEWRVAVDVQSNARRELVDVPEAVLIGVASRLVPFKGHEVLIRAFARVVRKIPTARLLIAGDGPLASPLRSLAGEMLPSGTFSFLGFIDDIRTFMAATDIVVFPTLRGFGEGFGLTALEAMAAERPVIATRLDSLPEVVLEGTTGLLVEPGDVEDLATQLIRLSDNAEHRKEMGRAGLRRALSQFSLSVMAEKTAQFYRRLLE